MKFSYTVNVYLSETEIDQLAERVEQGLDPFNVYYEWARQKTKDPYYEYKYYDLCRIADDAIEYISTP